VFKTQVKRSLGISGAGSGGRHGDTTGIARDNEERVEKGGSKMTSIAICRNWADQSGARF
jgi:hypothetical protein